MQILCRRHLNPHMYRMGPEQMSTECEVFQLHCSGLTVLSPTQVREVRGHIEDFNVAQM